MSVVAINMIMVVLIIPFYTLFERKVLSYMQLRKGPKKVGVLGVIQPVTDGAKLIFKEGSFPSASKSLVYWGSPLFSFSLMLFSWALYPNGFSTTPMLLGLILFLCFSSVSVYTTLGSGWGSKSKYTLLGALRGTSQSISYEMCLITFVFFPAFMVKGFSFPPFIWGVEKALVNILLLMVFFFLFLCETNRAPFDFAEGESELVSGFKMEYSGLSFAFLFLGEYGKILFGSFLLSLFFMPSGYASLPLFCMISSILFLIVRGGYPRFRFDLLMSLCWNIFLPMGLFIMFSYFVV